MNKEKIVNDSRRHKEPPSLDPREFRVFEEDIQLFEKHLKTFVPPGAFDIHAHWYDLRHIATEGPAHFDETESMAGFEAYRKTQSRWMGDLSPQEGLFFPFPRKNLDTTLANATLIEELKSHQGCRGLAVIRPDDDPVEMETLVRDNRLAGFKPYHVFADRADSMNAECAEYLPEWAWEIANRRGLCIMLHIVLPKALADERNQTYIQEFCRKYPEARLILAHAARGFCARHTTRGIEAIEGLPNVYFDTSAVCEPEAFEIILDAFGPGRLMYGSDFPVSEFRGKAISVGDGFFWIHEHNSDWEGWKLGNLTLAGIESLLALKQACRSRRLKDSDIERIFQTNATHLLGLGSPATGDKGQDLYRRAQSKIPGGTQLLSKRPDLYAPGVWPPYYREAKGCEVVDLDGRRFIDFSTGGIGACLLGYAHPRVDSAVLRRIGMGSACTLNCPEEVELSERLTALHSWSGMARLARSGGEALSIAVRIARAFTGRDKVAFCGYHGWTDWYLSANLRSSRALDDHLLPGLPFKGVPSALEGSAVPFAYNRLDELERIAADDPEPLAAVVMEPTRSTDPYPGFLEGVRSICNRIGAVMVFDEVTTGFRFHLGGVHLKYGVYPDIAVFAKALGNGYPVAAIIGRENIMNAANETFISSTAWSEGVGPAAALASLDLMAEYDIPSHVKKMGTFFRQGLLDLAQANHVPLLVSGHPALTFLKLDCPESDALLTLFTIRMLNRGFLASGAFYPTFAHQEDHLERFLSAAEPVIEEISEAIEKNDAGERIGGAVKQPPFPRWA